MTPQVRHLLLDTWRRGRSYFALAVCFSVLLAAVSAGTAPLGARLWWISAAAWSLLHVFVLQPGRTILVTLPLSATELGRWRWWCLCGINTLLHWALTACCLLVVAWLGSNEFDGWTIAFNLFCIGGVGGFAWLLCEGANSNFGSIFDGIPRARQLRWVCGASYALLIYLVITDSHSRMMIAILAGLGYFWAMVGYFAAEHFGRLLRNRGVAQNQFAPTQRVGDAKPRWWNQQRGTWLGPVMSFGFVAALLVLSPSLRDGTFGPVPQLLAGFAFLMTFTSGYQQASLYVHALRFLRSLPISAHRLTGMLLYRTARGTLFATAFAGMVNVLAPFTSMATIATVALHLTSVQFVYPAYHMRAGDASSTFRIFSLLSGFLWATVFTLFAFGGALAIVWIATAMCAILGYRLSYTAILRNSDAYRVRDPRMEESEVVFG
jgi:hypothetical protein